MKRFANQRPKNLEDAVSALHGAAQEGRQALPAGGGSDLLGMIKDELVSPDVLVDLKPLDGLEGIRQLSQGLHIGGLTTLQEVGRHPLIRSTYRVLAEAAESVGTPQIRNVGTLAGNLCQRPWCWYYRQGFPCLKHGGDRCFSPAGENQFHSIFGGGPSFIVHPSDTAPALLALEARFRIQGPQGERWVPASDFFVLPRENVARENVLRANEILTEIRLLAPQRGSRSTYVKLMDREAWTHATVSVALTLVLEDGVCQQARLVLGGVAPMPWRLPEVERLLTEQHITPELARRAGEQAVSGAQPLSKNGYKVPLTAALVRRTLLSLVGSTA